MKPLNSLMFITIFMTLLIISIPFAFAEENNLVYNKNGALVTGDSFYREYNGFGQLIKIHLGNSSNGNITEEFVWHPTEERILQKRVYFNNGTIKEKVTYVNQNYIVVKNSSGIFNETYVYQDGSLVAQIDANGNKYSVHDDHLGSASLLVNSSGNVVESSFYEPFGSIISGGQNSRYDFTGKELDNNINEYDFGPRYYNPNRIKFGSPDSFIAEYNPQSLNRYSYALNNPYKMTDDSGNSPTLVTAAIGVVAGGIIGGAISFGVQAYQNHGDLSKVDYGAVGKSAAVGAVAGGVAGLTFGLSAVAAGGTATGAGLSASAEVGIGAASGVAGGRAGQVTSNALEGEGLTNNLFNAQDIGTDAVLGGATAGLARGIRSTQVSKSFEAGTFDSPEASFNYHYDKHVTQGGSTLSKFQYSEKAKLFKFNLQQGKLQNVNIKNTITKSGKPATKATCKCSGEFGIFTKNKVVTYGPPKPKSVKK